MRAEVGLQLSRFTDYGLRVLIYSALNDHRNVSASEIAQRYGVSRNHLVKVVHALAQRGFVRTSRGKGGGISLAQAPDRITVGMVVRAMEPTLTVIDCHRPPCPLVSACVLKRALNEARDHFVDTLNRYTIRDLIRDKESLRALVDRTEAALG